MQVGVGVARHIIVEDDVDTLNVNPTTCGQADDDMLFKHTLTLSHGLADPVLC